MSKNAPSVGAVVTVCLGSGIAADGTASETTHLRAVAAIELYQSLAQSLAQTGQHMTIIVSGDGRKEETPAKRARLKTEAALMAEILKKSGIPSRHILQEGQSRDTIGNAILTSVRYLHGLTPRRLYLVTSPFHTTRALASFHGALGDKWEIIPYPCAVASDDHIRGANEKGGIDWTNAFFQGINPGDLPAVVKRLLEKGKPPYRRLRRLNSFKG